MEVAYVCEWERRPQSTHCPSVPLVCSWSCRNLVAFTSDLKNQEDEKDVSQMIHIIDTDHPWDVYSINSGHAEVISCLEWDQSGSRLLSADGDGNIKCWTMAEHLVNSWESNMGSSLAGEPIVALSWLHNGVKLALHVEMSGSTNFGEKFSRVKFSPSLTLFGGKPMEGWLAVSISGLVTVSLLKPNGTLLTSSESLCRLRGRVALADIAFTGGGNIVVAATDGCSTSPVQFYKVVVTMVNEKCRIDTELLPSLFMRLGEKQPTILKWRILSATNDLERVSAVALPKLPISISNTDLKVASDTKFCPGLGLALSFHDGSLQILHRLSLHTMGVFYGPGGSAAAGRPGEDAAAKRQRTGGPAVHFKALQFSWTSLALAGVDNQGKLLDMNTTLRHLLFLLEYCMVTGYDWWDVLLHVQPAMVHSLLSSATAARACDFHAKLLLMAISSTFKSLLRPHTLHSPDKNIDKVMINLKTEEFVLDGPPLQSLQQLIQWVGDFVLYLLANLPNQASFGFLRDGSSLGMLREMMVMIRIWGLLKPGCLPIYTATSDSQDSMDDAPPQEPDEALVDECCLLPSQLLVPTMDWLPVNDGVIVRLQGKLPLRLQGQGVQWMDNLRCLHLGVCPTEDSKACTRRLRGEEREEEEESGEPERRVRRRKEAEETRRGGGEKERRARE
ncbi:hypothetical protein CRUP_030297 [Coryphaenoides rupestris]|nr:hypothetical protein CRUP_030297 [Coryphaenoides rupestris]